MKLGKNILSKMGQKNLVKMVRLLKFKKENRKSQVSSESHADYNDCHELNNEQCVFFFLFSILILIKKFLTTKY